MYFLYSALPFWVFVRIRTGAASDGRRPFFILEISANACPIETDGSHTKTAAGATGGSMDYTTIRAGAQAEYVEKKSRFLAFLRPVDGEKAAADFLAEMRHTHPDARHHVFACVLPDTERCSDDGEPSGTAGQPVLSVLRKRGFTCVAAVVVRYFGGVLLGAPGLVRAYGHAVSLAADAAEPVVLCACVLYAFSCAYTELSTMERLARRMGHVRDITYTEVVSVLLAVPQNKADAFRTAVTECSCGRVVLREQGEIYEEESAFV
ncbi:MAG: YigZ family protein [Ethanoligenens sp.]